MRTTSTFYSQRIHVDFRECASIRVGEHPSNPQFDA